MLTFFKERAHPLQRSLWSSKRYIRTVYKEANELSMSAWTVEHILQDSDYGGGGDGEAMESQEAKPWCFLEDKIIWLFHTFFHQAVYQPNSTLTPQPFASFPSSHVIPRTLFWDLSSGMNMKERGQERWHTQLHSHHLGGGRQGRSEAQGHAHGTQ